MSSAVVPPEFEIVKVTLDEFPGTFTAPKSKVDTLKENEAGD